MSSFVIENIYYAISRANETPLISGKIGYLITAQSMLEALVMREGEDLHYPIRIPYVEDKEFKIIELKNKEELIKFIEKGIIRLKDLLYKNPGEIAKYDLRILQNEGDVWDVEIAPQFLTVVEDEKALLIKILIAAGYDQVSFAQLERATEEKREEKKVQFTRL